MLLDYLVPSLPSSALGIIFVVLAILGGIMLVYAVFVERELQHDILRAIGSLSIIPHTLYAGSSLTGVILAAVAVASLLEFFEIFTGIHHHSRRQVHEYQETGKK